MILFVTVTGCMTKACIEPFFHYAMHDDTCPSHKSYHYDMNYHLDQATDKKYKGKKDGYKNWKPHKMPKEDRRKKEPLRRGREWNEYSKWSIHLY